MDKATRLLFVYWNRQAILHALSVGAFRMNDETESQTNLTLKWMKQQDCSLFTGTDKQ
jgi:hypothetical protein